MKNEYSSKKLRCINVAQFLIVLGNFVSYTTKAGLNFFVSFCILYMYSIPLTVWNGIV